MTISIIICTRNRAEHLRATLASVANIRIPGACRVDFTVIDNGSTDHTEAVVREAASAWPSLAYVVEPRPGLSHARNTGLAATSGEIILFTDDDIRVPADWLEGMCRPIAEGTADAVAGGVIFPPEISRIMSVEPYARHRSWWASTEELDSQRPHRMVGANMAFHRRVLTTVPGFDPELGPGALGFGDESLFSRQLITGGFRIAGALNVAVEHHFDQNRLSPESVLDAARKMGRSRAFVFHHWEHGHSRGAHIWKWKCLARLFILRRSHRVPGSVTDRQVQVERDLAFCREYLAQRRRSRKYPLRGLAPTANSSAG